jgi:hypothetical protein
MMSLSNFSIGISANEASVRVLGVSADNNAHEQRVAPSDLEISTRAGLGNATSFDPTRWATFNCVHGLRSPFRNVSDSNRRSRATENLLAGWLVDLYE